LGLWASIVLHGGFITAVVVTPLLTPAPSQPIRFVSVALVSAQALGVSDPEPVAPAPPRRTQPTPEPTRPKPETPTPRARTTTPEPAPAQPTASETLRRRQGSPTGSATGTAPLGARVGFDNPNFRHSYFVDRLSAMLASQWQRPALGGDVVALVHFTIHRNGSVSGLEVVESSGYSSYDLAALRAVQQAAPFPPLPQSYTQDSLGVTVEFI
jgi:TonB family protein